MEVKCPPKCTACFDACPTGALYESLKMDPRRCIAFNTFMTQDDYLVGVTSYIPLTSGRRWASGFTVVIFARKYAPETRRS